MKINNVDGNVVLSDITVEDVKALKQWFFSIEAQDIDQFDDMDLNYRQLESVCEMVDDIYKAIKEDIRWSYSYYF